jgi:phage head maturation protease
MAKVEIIELLIDETKLEAGINAVSVVESPAIEENFIALKKHEVELKEVDAEKRILMGAALVPNKQIYRRNKDKEFYIYFSEDTVRKASELFLMRSNQNNATYEHERKMLDGMSVVESWIIEDEKTDKSRLYNFNLPKGTWMISMKVNNDDVWQKVKDGEVKGFSIEGHFVDQYEMSLQENEEERLINAIRDLILKDEEYKLETYNDYPKEASENAKIALRYAEENGWGDCLEATGKARANQLANGENISRETISRMASFERHRQNSQKELGDGCGRLAWLAWGGDAGIEWAQRKLEQIDNK